MTHTSDDNSNNDDADLWGHVADSVEPLTGKSYVAKKESPKPKPETKKPTVRSGTISKPSPKSNPKPPQSKEVDTRTAEKLRRGQMEIEAKLDLHGHSRERAHEALNRFITASQASGKRCVLVVTGKGGRDGSPGILRREVPNWLHEGGLNNIVLRHEKARPNDGGEGALYVLIRRNRD